MGKMAEIDYENQQKDKDGTEGVVDLEKKMKPVKKGKTSKPKKKENDTDYIIGLIDNVNESIKAISERIDTLSERIDLTGTRGDNFSKGMDNMKNLLDRVADRMGLK